MEGPEPYPNVRIERAEGSDSVSGLGLQWQIFFVSL